MLVAYKGPAATDGAPVRVLLTCVTSPAQNRKTGDMVKVSFMRDDVSPLQATSTGADRTVCGDCPHRPRAGNTCYVMVGWWVQNSWRHSNRIRADIAAALEAVQASGKPLRLGAYGNPSSAPHGIAASLVHAARDDKGRARHTAYIHDWRTAPREWRSIAMASVDSPAERDEAKALGYRTFRTRLAGEPRLPGEIVCPASDEAGNRTNCAKCLLCSGTSGRGKRDVVITVHGRSRRQAELARLQRRLDFGGGDAAA